VYKIRKIGILLSLLFLPVMILALDLPKIPLDLDISFEHLSFEDGLLMSTTRIAQDHMGYLWFGTAVGLYRYDGYEFKCFFPRAGVPTDIVSRIQGICEDQSGNIWFGEYGFGLYRLDGKTGEFTNFRHNPNDTTSLSGEEGVCGFFLDSRGLLWMATTKDFLPGRVYLDRLDTKTGRLKRYRYNDTDVRSLTADCVCPAGIGYWNPLVIDEDSKGDIWIGICENGVVRYNREQDDFTRFVHDPDDPASLSSNMVTNLTMDKDGTVWIFTQNGLNRFDPSFQTMIHFQHDPYNINSLGSDACFGGILDRSRRLWISHEKGLDRYDPETGAFEHFRHDPHNPKTPSRADSYLPVYEDAYGAIWILTHGDFSALNVFDPYTYSFHRFENNPNDPAGYHMSVLTSYASDHSQCLWIGSHGGVMNKIYANRNRFYLINQSGNRQNNLPGSRINDIMESKKEDGIIWIATPEGLSRLDWHQGTVRHYQHDPQNRASLSYNDIRCIEEDDGGNIWLLTRAGVDKLDALDSFTHYRHDPDDSTTLSMNDNSCFGYDPKGFLWIGTGNGTLDRLDVRSGRVKRIGRYHNQIGDSTRINAVFQILTAYADRSGKPWFGADLGLSSFDHRNRHFTHWSKTVPTRMYEDRFGNLWIGAYGAGLYRFDRETGQEHFFPEGHPLTKSQIRDICEDRDGLLWIGTDHGLVRLDPRDNSCLSLSKQHGLAETLFLTCGVQLRNGWMIWGTSSKGLILFDPQSIRQNTDRPQVVISDILVSNKPLSMGMESPLKYDLSHADILHLRHDQNDISFICAALNFVRPGKNQYAFWLENYDRDWREAGLDRTATYTNLDPGKYRFHVKASNSEGAWTETGTSLQIRIHPPWYASWWAYVLYCMIAAGIAVALWTSQMRRIRLGNELKYKRMEAEKLQEIDGMKTRFLANISHEFRTPLTLISGPLEQLLKEAKDPQSVSEIKIMRRNAERLVRLVNQLLDLSKIEAGKMSLKARQDDLVSFVNRVVQSFESRAKLKQIDLSFHSQHPFLDVYIDHEKMENVLYNLIANAIKFTPKNGRIEVTVESSESQPGLPSADSRAYPASGTSAIAVRDTGPGISEHQLERIFDRFYQVEDPGTCQEAGTGIGLALAKELVEMHHGRLTVVSRVGEGSIFTVILPLGRSHFSDADIVEASHLPQPVTEEAEPLPSPEKSTGSPGKGAPGVLVVEDNADLRYYIRSILHGPFRIFEAEAGERGFERAVKEMPDLILSDVMMPGMDGFELCEKLKTDERTSHIPVILLTARADMDSRLQGLGTGADDYLVKPFNGPELRARANNLIRQRQKLRARFGKDLLIPMKDIAVTSADERFLHKAVDHITQNLGEAGLDLASLCEHMGLSRSQLHRKLKAIVNMSATEFIRSIRLRRAAELLKKRYGNVAEIAFEVGFNNPAYFSECFRKQFGVLPSEYKQG
jgi:signal transduction histidine kinase/DNA-binding response OmpR family regulator/streptogramin lyase